MIRKYVVAKDKEDLRGRLLKAGIRESQAASAMDALRRVNAHADLNKLAAGAVLLVPDAAGLDPRDSVSLAAAALDGFSQIVLTALTGAAARIKAGNTARATERDGVTAAISDARTRKLFDPNQDQMATAALAAQLIEQQQADEAEKDLAAADAATRKALEDLAKLLA